LSIYVIVVIVSFTLVNLKGGKIEMELTFAFEKATKNTYRYQEVENDSGLELETVVGTLYIQKAALEALGVEDEDDELTVSLEVS